MYRTHTCGELRLANAGQKVTLAGWVQRVRKMGGMSFIDLRDRYGITQIIIDESASKELNEQVEKLGREYVIQVTGTVLERQSRNSRIDTLQNRHRRYRGASGVSQCAQCGCHSSVHH